MVPAERHPRRAPAADDARAPRPRRCAVSVLLPGYLTAIGFSPLRVGAIVFGTLLGSAGLTLWVGLATDRLARRRVLLAACALMLLTGIGFATTTSFWPLFVVAVVWTSNPSACYACLSLLVEQAALAEAADPPDLTAMFALYNVAGAFAGAFGALASGLPAILAARHGWGALACAALGLRRVLDPRGHRVLVLSAPVARHRSRAPAAQARAAAEVARVCLPAVSALQHRRLRRRLLEEFRSLLALWLFRRFNLSVQMAGAFFFAAGLLGSFSNFISAALAARFGRINTMVFSHLPSNAMLDIRRADADAGLRDGLSAAALVDVADGRARAPILRDGGGAARGARRRR